MGGQYGASRFDNMDTFSNTYSTPGGNRAKGKQGFSENGNTWNNTGNPMRGKTIDGQIIASSINDSTSDFKVGDRVFHLKFGNGNIAAVDGNKLTIDFDKAGQKRVLDSFVEGV